MKQFTIIVSDVGHTGHHFLTYLSLCFAGLTDCLTIDLSKRSIEEKNSIGKISAQFVYQFWEQLRQYVLHTHLQMEVSVRESMIEAICIDLQFECCLSFGMSHATRHVNIKSLKKYSDAMCLPLCFSHRFVQFVTFPAIILLKNTFESAFRHIALDATIKMRIIRRKNEIKTNAHRSSET